MKSSSKNQDVIVVGAGAAGLLCAITAARRGRNVLILEKANKVGKKILMSGGGRCNFTNHFVEAENFLSGNPHFCKSALNRYTQWDFIAMVESHGIAYEERKHGQLFCMHSAKDILIMLLEECDQAGVEIKTHCDIKKVESLSLKAEAPSINERSDGGQHETGIDRYQIDFLEDHHPLSLNCHSLVIATGALSIPTLGGSGWGYDIAQQFGLSLTQRQAGLVPFMFSDFMKPICERLSGLALEVEVSCNGQSFTENLLFTHRGISGPVILQISNYWRPGDEICINLLPDPGTDINANTNTNTNTNASTSTSTSTAEWLVMAKQQQGKSLLKTLLNYKLPKSLVSEIQTLWWPEFADRPLAEFSDKQLVTLGKQLTQWRLKPSGTEGYRTAEVTLGGVETDGISSKSMEAKQQAGLYFIGEVLDVTGYLGGYNFQWAWSSGFSAGLFV